MSNNPTFPTSGNLYTFPALNTGVLYINGKIFQEYLDEAGSGLTAPELAEVKSLLEYLDITGLNSAWTVANNNVNETLRSAITALQTKLVNIDTTALTSPSVLTDANKNSALKTAIDTITSDLTALAVRVTTEEGNVDNLQTKTANLDTTGLTSPSILTDANKNSVLKTALDALANTPGDVTALALRVTTAEGDIDALEGRATSLEGRATSLEGRATSLEGRATAVENRATTLEGKTQFTTVSNTYFDNNSGTAQPYGIPFGDFDGPTYPIGSFKMEVGPTLASGQGKSYFEITHKNLVQHPNFPAGEITQAQFSDILRCVGIRSYYRKGATPGIYNLSNETFLQHTDENGEGRVTVKAKRIRIYPQDTDSIVEIGRFTGGAWSNSDIRIGGKGNQVNIGSMEDDELAQGVGDVATKTRIYIGRRPTTGNAGDVLNSQLILRGDVWTGNLNWKDLAVTAPLSIETLIAFLSPNGLPSFIFSSLFGGGLSLPKSDVVVMKGTLSKRGDIETSNALSIEKMSIINTSVGNLTPGFTMFFAQHDVTSTQLIGNHRTGVFQGEISLKNYNVVSTGVNFVSAEENDLVNVLSIKGNSGIILHQGASSNNEPMDIFNSKSGPIRLFIGADGTRAGTTHGGAYIMRYLEPFGNNLVATGETKVILGSRIGIDSALASEAYQGDGFGQGKVATDAQLVIEPSTKVDTLRRQGINVRHKTIVNNLPVYTQSIINSDSISTPSVEAESLKITANYGGSTSARLYKDANNKLYWNGEQISAVNYPLGAPTNQNVSNTYIDKSFNLYGNSDAGFPKQSALPTALYTGTPIRTASTEAELSTAISIAGDYDVIRITANITLTVEQTISKKLKIEGTSNAIVVTYNTGGNLFTITSSEVWFSALTFYNANSTSNANILNFSSSSAVKNYVSGCIFQTNEFAISSNNQNIQITDNTFQFVGSADSHRYIILSGCLGSCFINNNTFHGNGGASTQCVNINNGVASAFLNGNIIISGNVSAINPVQRLLMVDISLAGSNISFYVSRNVMTTTSGFIIFYSLPFDGIKQVYLVQNTETLGSGITGGKGIIGLDSPSSSVISFNTIVYSSGNSPAVLRADYTNLVNPSANQNGVIAYATARFTPGATTYNVVVPFLINLDAIVPETQNLGAVMALGNTASTTLNMNNNGITNVASIQGWNVQEITPGTNISAISSFNNYTIANTAPVQNVTASTNIGVAIANNTATLTNTAPVQNVIAGTGGITVSYNGTTATISHVGIGGGGGGGGSQTIHDLDALEEVGAFRQPNSWAKNWYITDDVVSIRFDMYCSVDGKIIASSGPVPAGDGPVRYSLDYGTSWASGDTNVNWRSITGTSSGSKLFATGYFIANPNTYVYYTSTTQGATWTSHNINSVINSSPSPILSRIRSSGDGSHLIMCDEREQAVGFLVQSVSRIFVSANGGSSWTEKTLTLTGVTTQSGYSINCAMSRSGRYQYVLSRASNVSFIHRSDDFGVTWTFIFGDLAFFGSDDGMFTRIECDSTGRHLYLTRRTRTNTTAPLPMYQSSDFGTNWVASGLNIAMLDVWVSATGQHVCAVSILQGFLGSVIYFSSDYGRTWGNVPMGIGTSFRCLVGSGDGSTLALGAVNSAEFGGQGDGKIRVARSTRDFEPAVMSWGSYSLNTGTSAYNLFQYNFTFAGYPKIDLTQYNIKYEFDCLWNANGSAFGQAFPQLTLNGYSTAEQSVNGTTAQPATTQFSINLTNGGGTFDVVAQDQLYRGKCYMGYSPPQTDGTTYRNRTLLNGEITLQERPLADVEPSISGVTDHSHYAKTIINNFTCNSYVLEKDGVAENEWYLFHHATPGVVGLQLSHQMIRGSSVWETGSYIWSGVANSISTGVSGVGFKLMTNVGNNLASRTGLVKLRLWRVKK